MFPPLDKVIQITEYKILSLRVLPTMPIIIQIIVTLFKMVKENSLLFPIFTSFFKMGDFAKQKLRCLHIVYIQMQGLQGNCDLLVLRVTTNLPNV